LGKEGRKRKQESKKERKRKKEKERQKKKERKKKKVTSKRLTWRGVPVKSNLLLSCEQCHKIVIEQN
jgi:hypothetical protein